MNEYYEKLKDPRWQKKRLEVMHRDGFKCLACGDDKSTLNVHHLIYSGDPWDAPMDTLETLCEDHHEWREEFNRFWEGRSLASTKDCIQFYVIFQAMFSSRKIPKKIYADGVLLFRKAVCERIKETGGDYKKQVHPWARLKPFDYSTIE